MLQLLFFLSLVHARADTCEDCVNNGRVWCGNSQECVTIDSFTHLCSYEKFGKTIDGQSCQAMRLHQCPTKGQTSCGPPIASLHKTADTCTSNNYSFCIANGVCYEGMNSTVCPFSCSCRSSFECAAYGSASSCAEPNSAISATPGQLPSLASCIACTQSGWSRYCFDSGSCTHLYAPDCPHPICYAMPIYYAIFEGNTCGASTLDRCKSTVGSSWGQGSGDRNANPAVFFNIVIGGAAGGGLALFSLAYAAYSLCYRSKEPPSAAQQHGTVTIRVHPQATTNAFQHNVYTHPPK